MLDAIRSVLIPVHREGYKFIAIFAAATLALFMFSDVLGWVGVILTLWCVYFFRDPDRVAPVGESLVLSPADGVINLITKTLPPPELGLGDEALVRVSVFMNVFNCHVNRVPMAGTITKIIYHPGRFINASLDKASEDNERQSFVLEISAKEKIAFTQIAGLVARRIVAFVQEGDALQAGERFGMIRFGSRVDVYLPAGIEPLVRVGQTAIGGETVLADLKGL